MIDFNSSFEQINEINKKLTSLCDATAKHSIELKYLVKKTDELSNNIDDLRNKIYDTAATDKSFFRNKLYMMIISACGIGGGALSILTLMGKL